MIRRLDKKLLVKYRVAEIEVTETVQDYSMSIPDSYKGLYSYLKAFLSVSTGLFYGTIIIALLIFYFFIKQGECCGKKSFCII